MNKKFSIIIALFLGLGLFLGSCSDDDDKDQVSEEWIDYQKKWFENVTEKKDKTGEKIYTELESNLWDKKYIYHRPSDFITNNLKGEFGKLPEAFPEEEEAKSAERAVIEEIEFDTDIAVTRYHGWYYNLEGKKVIFDSTETDLYGNSLNNGGKASEFAAGGSLIDGFRTILYDMKVGEERIVCIPHKLAYGIYTYKTIPGYTTLFFDIKLMEIKR